MAIKSTLISTVNSFYTILITISKVKASLLEIINNFYGTIINDTQATTNVFTASDAVNLQYSLSTVKQGRFVNVSGTLTKTTDELIEASEWLNITASEYLPSAIHNFHGVTASGTVVKLSFHPTGELFLDSFIGGDATISIGTIYNTAN